MPRLPLLIASTLLLGATLQAQAANPRSGAWTAFSQSRSYTAIPVASDDTINPLRGYYRWQNQELVPQPAPPRMPTGATTGRTWKAPPANTISAPS
jgi:hypothetical protein